MGIDGRSYPNQFATNYASTGVVTVSFGFNASLIRIMVDTGSANISFTTSPATTADAFFRMTSGETHDFYDLGVSIYGLSLASTSTGATGRIGAWG